MIKVRLKHFSKSTPEIEEWLEKTSASVSKFLSKNEEKINNLLRDISHDFIVYGIRITQEEMEKRIKELNLDHFEEKE